MTITRIHLVVAALFGLCGVSALASGAHVAGGQMTLAGQMLLFHAPALMAGTLARKAGHLHATASQIALAMLTLGVALFAADMAMRGLYTERLFAMAAPVGGMLAIAGWLGMVVAALLPQQNR
ncbi:MAG: DUF423 domain-containing protein [Bosea sp. (in: a-proteobacteria)]